MALFAVAILFSACRENASQNTGSEEPAQTEEQVTPEDTEQATPNEMQKETPADENQAEQ